MQINHHVGRLVRPIKVDKVGSKQTSRAYFSLAVARSKGNETDFISYVAFGKTADLLGKYGTEKGQILELNFEIHSSKYADKNGEIKFSTAFLVDQFHFWSFASNASEDDQAVEGAGYESQNEPIDSTISRQDGLLGKAFDPTATFDDIPDYGEPNDSIRGEY